MHESRKMFSNSLEAIMQVLASLDLHSGGPANPVNQTAKECNDFKNYVKSQLYLKNAKDKLNDAAISGLMTPEDYYELRVLPLLEEIEKQEGKLRLATRLLQISSMISSSIAVVLGSAGETIFIPVAIAAATGLFQFLKVNDYERRFEIASSAARELRALNSHWESLSDLDHQMRGSIVHLVRTCEQLALQYMTTSAIQVEKAEVGMENGPVRQQQHFTPTVFGQNSV